MTCEVSGCGEPAAGRHTWGPYPDGDRNRDVPLCPACAADLWGRLNGLVVTGQFHYAVRAVEDVGEACG